MSAYIDHFQSSPALAFRDDFNVPVTQFDLADEPAGRIAI